MKLKRILNDSLKQKWFRLDIRLTFFKQWRSSETLKIYWRVISLLAQNNKLVTVLFEIYKSWDLEQNPRLEENVKTVLTKR